MLCHIVVFRRRSSRCQNDSATKQQGKQLRALLESELLKIPVSDLVRAEIFLLLCDSCAQPLNQRQSFCHFNRILVFLIANFLLRERGRLIKRRRDWCISACDHDQVAAHCILIHKAGFNGCHIKVLLALTSVITVSQQRCKRHQPVQDSKVL